MCTLARKEKLPGTYLVIISACSAQLWFVVMVVQSAEYSQLILKSTGAEYLQNLLDEVLNPWEVYSDCM